MQIPEPMDKLTPAEWQAMGISRTKFEDRWSHRLQRDQASPAIGDPAPDFDLELLSADGKRTAEQFRLSSVAGRPVGLIFGSYT